MTRKSFFSRIAASGLLALVTLMPAGCKKTATPPTTETPPPPGLTVKDGHFHLGGKPLRAVGVNYYELFTRLAAKPADESTLQGLQQLAKSGVPFVRFNAGGYSAKDWQRYLSNKEAHFAQMDRVVRAAESAGIGLIPSLFWSRALCEAAGEHAESWGNAESRTSTLMRDYTTEMVTRYRQSPAIWAWEFGNEWNLSADLPNAADQRKPGQDERDDLKNAHLGVAIKGFTTAVRSLDATRPLITGHSHPRAAAWHNTHEKSWKSDSPEQWREIVLRDNPEPVDTIGIHIYADTEAREACAQWTTGWPDYLGKLRALATELQRPIFIGEFGLAEGGKFNPEQVKTRFRDIIAGMEAANIDLAAVWVFDLPSQGKDWNVTFSNERAYMLQDVIEANRRWSGK